MQPLAHPKRILVVRTDRMGDLLMSLPAVRAVREAFPQTEVTLLIQEGLKPLIQSHPDIDHLLTIRPKDLKGWRKVPAWAHRLRRAGFDTALVLNPTRFFHVAVFLAGIPIRVGYQRKWGRLLTRRIPDTKAERTLHESVYNLELVRLLGIPAEKPLLHLPSTEEADTQARRLLETRGIPAGSRPIAIHPWTSNPVKSWPLHSFLEVAERLKPAGHPILLIGEPAPSSVCGVEGLGASGIVDLVGKVPLRLLPALLKQCGALISNDSGPSHVAAAVGTPTVVVAPREHEATLQRWKPLGERVRILLSPDLSFVEQTVLSCLSEDVRNRRNS